MNNAESPETKKLQKSGDAYSPELIKVVNKYKKAVKKIKKEEEKAEQIGNDLTPQAKVMFEVRSKYNENEILDGRIVAENKEELKEMISVAMKSGGSKVRLNFIDTSKITDMSHLFFFVNFDGDISKWNTSAVTDMSDMFYGSKNFNQDISGWNVSKVSKRKFMFYGCPIKEEFKPKFQEVA